MERLDRKTYANWRANTLSALARINNITGNEFTGEGYYDLCFRGRSHKTCLTLDGDIIARGIVAINEHVYALMKYYHII